MKCIDNLGVKYSNASKTRGRLITSVISLSSALMFVLGLMIIMTVGIWLKWDVAFYGDFDARYVEISEEEVKLLSEDDNFISVGRKQVTGLIKSDIRSDIQVFSADAKLIDGFNYKLKEGNYPINSNEVALSESAIEYLEIDGSIGNDFKLSYEGVDGTKYNENFTLTGIIKDNKLLDQDNELIIVSNEYADKVEVIYSLFVEKKMFADLGDITEQHNISRNTLRFPLSRSDMVAGIMGPTILVGMVIIILGIVSIGNIFAYTISERIKTIGLLKSIGMTQKQLKGVLKKEGYQFLRRGFIYGFIIGVLAFSFMVVGQYIVSDKSSSLDSLVSKLDLNIFLIKDIWLMVIFMFLITFITVWLAVSLSINIPFRKTKKISITNSINYVANKNVRPKRNNVIIKKVPSKLAFVNFRTSKLKTILPSLFLGISASLFIFFTIFLNSMDSDVLADHMTTGDIVVEGKVTEDLINEIKRLDSVDEIGIASHVNTFIPYDNIRFSDSFVDKEEFINGQKEKQSSGLPTNIVSYNDIMFEELGLDKLKDNEVYLRDRYRYSNYEIGDQIQQIIIDEYGNENLHTFTIKGYIYKSLHRNIPYVYGTPLLITNQNSLDNIKSNANFLGLFIDGDVDITKEEISKHIDEKQVRITTINEIKQDLYEEYFLIFSMGYGLFIVIAVLSFTMIINNIYTSITSRKKEFAILRSVGMTKSQLNKYLLWEANIYMILVVIISIPLGYNLAKYFIDTLAEQNAHFVWKFPISSLSIIVVYYLIIYVVTRLVFNKMDKYSVSELLRY